MTALFNNISVKIRLVGFIALLIFLFLLTGIFGLNGMKETNISISNIYNYQVIPLNELRTIDNLMHFGVVNPVDRLLFEQMTWEECLVLVEKSVSHINERWENLHRIHRRAGPEDTDWLNKANTLMGNSANVLNSLILLLRAKDTEKLDLFTDNKLYPLSESYTEIIDSLIQDRLAAVEKEYLQSQRRFNNIKNTFLWVLVVGIIASGILSLLLIQSINKPLGKIAEAMKSVMHGDLSKKLDYDTNDEFGILIRGFNQMLTYMADLIAEIEKSGIQVTSSITEIAATIKQQETTVNEQAATANEIAASTTEIAATSESLMATMAKVTDMAQNTAMAASQGHKRLSAINDTMKKMEQSTIAILNRLSILSEKATNIAGVTKTINKIADQTNLLSLNAAIEAEKAGEYGAGFSVVSSEIRRLADQTAVATFDIEQMVNEVQSAVSTGVMSIEKFAENVRQSFAEVQISSNQLSEVIEQVQALRPPIETVNEGISAQSMGAKQISEAVDQLNEAAQQTAESVSQTSATIFQLNKAAHILRDSVAKFKLKNKQGAQTLFDNE